MKTINQLLAEPNILLEKPLLSYVIGIAFLAAGILSLAVMKDMVFFVMSMLIAAYCIYIGVRLFRQILRKEYTVVEGKCTEKISISLVSFSRIGIEDLHEGIIYCKIKKKTASQIVQGCSYRIYFMSASRIRREFNHERFWCMEEL